MRDLDERFLRRALQLAERARGHTSPNPLVGAVLVREGRIVGEGFHPRAGEPHAEVFALQQAGELARGATAYVTLEPCDHFGRTPPCSLALLQAGVSRVVVAAREENPVAKGGLERLRSGGVQVEAGLLEAEARAQNEVFFAVQKKGLPFVLLKAALTLDGKVAAPSGDARWISSEASRRVAHAYRQWLPAVMVGVGTVLKDDPALTVREPDFRPFPLMVEPPPLRDPLKVVLDTEARTPPTARLFRKGPRGEPARVLVFVGEGAPRARVSALEEAGARVVALPREGGRVDPERALAFLLEEGVDGVLLEGGPRLAGAFLERGLVDKLALFLAPRILGEGRGLAEGLRVERVAEALRLRLARREWLGEDLWLEAYPEG
ncbi:bifunctional diaminohydroxyphosphoribosylaminopyrimidine deaminase/5-amino-6-(5-phosphoribosylamino)uracil reductase RibD [Thermus thermophilus]|uniref:bifunctional diaminohydroxyphosphoribosylaminopyrimidine deaminase/5-amino-6-(5-phosphoribosylamino)uracil reductase RibD n=1 Tax=Thermus thermophilus TaxID=274 RepID=UPI001162A115|nr:bifunctional diaminohydroxyphosphoribosylaminopyrimidine deaminase/5-amino-6-(5-phosphoribosylamino)uracil reductase RibD [Thermus thermophilus]BBL82301.1 riboflavin biosynthesis protein RibD [Thermus thermophilus]BBL84603.1 riboflavin biosynthesis protein RibD [Thermus thermophilus]